MDAGPCCRKAVKVQILTEVAPGPSTFLIRTTLAILVIAGFGGVAYGQQWSPLGPEGGQVQVIAIHPSISRLAPYRCR